MYIQQKGCHTFTVKLKKYPFVELKGQCHEISDPVLSNNYQRPGPIMNRKNQFGKLFRISMKTTACLFNAASPCRHPLSMYSRYQLSNVLKDTTFPCTHQLCKYCSVDTTCPSRHHLSM